MQYEIHEAAAEWPMMDDDTLAELVESMRRNGYDKNKPIVLFEGKILDGRNRDKASRIANVDPCFCQAPADCNPWEESWKHNGPRRDMPARAKAAVRAMFDIKSGTFESERRQRETEANQRRSEAQKGVPKAEAGERRTSDDVQGSQRRNAADASLAKRAGVSEATAGRINRVAKKNPELLPKIVSGEVTLDAALQASGRRGMNEWRRERGEAIPPPSNHKSSPGRTAEEASERDRRIAELHSKGLTPIDIGKQLGCTRRVVQEAKQRLGLVAKRGDMATELARSADSYAESWEWALSRIDVVRKSKPASVKVLIQRLGKLLAVTKRLAAALSEEDSNGEAISV